MSNHDEEEDFAAMLADYGDGHAEPEIGTKATGTIVSMDAEVAFVDLGGKSEGLIDRTELIDEYGRLTSAVGDRIEALVTAIDESGNFVLRVRPGRGRALRSELEMAWKSGLPVEGLVTEVVKGGVEVTVSGLRGFCPLSQLDQRYVEDPETFVGQRFEFRIRELSGSDRRTNLVLSRRQLLEEETARRAAEVRQRLSVGAVLEGTVSTVTTYGAFVDLGGLEGLLHVSEMSYRRGIDPREVLREGERVEVKVLTIEPPKKPGAPERISLSTRALQRDPWDDAARRYPAGTLVKGSITRLEAYGAFVELEPGVEGLAHISRLGGKGGERHARELVELGQKLAVRVVDVDTVKRRIGLAREADERTDEEQREIEKYQPSRGGSGGFGSLGDFFNKGRKD